MWVFSLHVCVCAGGPGRPEEGVRSPETGVTEGCEPPLDAGNLTGSLNRQGFQLLSQAEQGGTLLRNEPS